MEAERHCVQSGLFKLLLPLPVPNKKETENVLFLLHPRQTLSHVATLVRSELLAANAGARHASSGTTSTPAQTAGSDDFNEITFHGQFRNPANLNDATGSSGKFKIASKWALSSTSQDTSLFQQYRK